MKSLSVEGTKTTPAILLDKAKSKFEISGKSSIEDTSEFYQPVLDWIKAYLEDPNPTTDFIFKLAYFNSSSTKFILSVLSVLEDIDDAKVIWCYHKDDANMKEAGEELSELVDIEFEFKDY